MSCLGALIQSDFVLTHLSEDGVRCERCCALVMASTMTRCMHVILLQQLVPVLLNHATDSTAHAFESALLHWAKVQSESTSQVTLIKARGTRAHFLAVTTEQYRQTMADHEVAVVTLTVAPWYTRARCSGVLCTKHHNLLLRPSAARVDACLHINAVLASDFMNALTQAQGIDSTPGQLLNDYFVRFLVCLLHVQDSVLG